MSLNDLRAAAEELQARVKAREQDVAAEMQRLREWEENPLPGAEKESPQERRCTPGVNPQSGNK